MNNNNNIAILKSPNQTNTIILLIVILVSCSMLILVNYYTIKTLSATRAYVNGESHYSKGHNGAVRNLITFLFTSNTAHWTAFKTNIRVPQGDATARIGLLKNLDTEIIKNGFRAGKNHDSDLDDMIWLFKNFRNFSHFKTAINEWKKGDYLNIQLYQIGRYTYQKIKTHQLDEKTKYKILSDINALSSKMVINQDAFSNSFGDGTREVKKYLIYTNIFFILMIIGSVSIYYTTMIKKLTFSKQKLSRQKNQLKSIIKDLEKTKEDLNTGIIQHKKTVGTISHDIRSPLKYIQLISKHLMAETKKNGDSTSNKYANSIYKSSNQLYEFTKTLIQYSKIYIEDRNYNQKPYSVYNLIENKKVFFDEIALNNNTVIINATNQILESDINIRIISIIIHNLLDNAVKNTNNGIIEIGSRIENKKIIYWVKDTGIGMNQDIIEYYSNLFNNRDPEKLILSAYGIGLHLVLELLIILKGNISFSSIINEGTLVTIEINISHNRSQN